jgi:uncharacterized protein YbjT (DUF2867 family)
MVTAKTRTRKKAQRILLTGATGFVGKALYPALIDAGCQVRCATRQPIENKRREPDKEWVSFDVERTQSMAAALQDIDTVYYFIHSMGQQGGGGDWATREETCANNFVTAASAANVKRIVYLGGVAPQGVASKHLKSRLRTGEILRAGNVPVIELRSGMIIGSGSASWNMVRDLSLRLPVMLLPAWLQFKSEPVGIADVVAALVHAGLKRAVKPGCYSLPGPEALSGQQTLQRIAALRGLQARMIRIPLLTPRLSSHWLRLVTRGDAQLAKELVQGYTSDLIGTDPSFFAVMKHTRTPFDVAAKLALEDERPHLRLRTAVAEWAIGRFAPWKKIVNDKFE